MAKKSHHLNPPTIDHVMSYLRSQSKSNIKKESCKNSQYRKKGSFRKTHSDDILPERMVVEITGTDSMGDLIARPLTWTQDTPAPQIIVTKDTLVPAAGIGDIVQVIITPQENQTYHAKTLRRVTTGDNRMLGVYEKGRLYSVDRRIKDSFIVTGTPTYEKLKDGSLILVDIPPVRVADPQARFVKFIGNITDPYIATTIAIYMHRLPLSFSEQVEKEASKLKKPRMGKNWTDLRSVPFVTIDGADARDFDDAVWAEPDKDGYHIMIGIADVSWFVRYGTALDSEARLRGNSVYFPDRVIPMLPPALSNELCSLKPGEDRVALVCEVWIDKNGQKKKHLFRRAMIRSARRLTYDEVQDAMDGKMPIRGLEKEIESLCGAYQALKKNRIKRGVLELDVPERQVILDNKGAVKAIRLREQYPSMQLIEELMILANVAAAETLEEKNNPVMYRIHASPSEEKLMHLKEALISMGKEIYLPENPEPADFYPVLSAGGNTVLSKTLHELVLRSQSQAAYSPDNIGHFGLALPRYAHFTSPIRRYADILVHRSLIQALQLGEGGLTDAEIKNFEETAHHISITERQAASAEIDATDRYIADFLQTKIGQVFNARIVSIMQFGLFLAIEPFGAEGFVTLRSLPGDYYDFEEENQRLVGRSTGAVFGLGDTVRATLKECIPFTGSLLFQILQNTPRQQSFKRSVKTRGKAHKHHKRKS